MKRAIKVIGMAAAIILIAELFFSGGTKNNSYAAAIARTPIKTITGFKYGVGEIRFSPDGKIMAASDGETVKTWDMQTGKMLSSFVPHKEMVRAIALTPDGTTIATGGCDQYKSTDSSTGEEYYACEESVIKFWNVQTGQLIRTLPGHNGFWMERGERWDERLQRNVMEKMYVGGGIRWLEFSKDGKILVCLNFGGLTDKFLDVESGRDFRVYESKHLLGANFSPDGKTLALQGQGGILLMDYRTGDTIIQLEDGEAPVFSPDGRFIASACGDETIKLWDITQKKPIRTFFGHTDDPFAVAFSVDGKVLASGGNDKIIILWDVENGGEIARLPGHRSSVGDLKFTPDGKMLVSGGWETKDGVGTVKFWDATSFSGQAPAKAYTGTQSHELAGHEGQVQMISISPQGDRLASVSQDAFLKVWDMESGKELFTVHGDRMGGSYESVAYSADGRIIATGACGVVQLIDAQTGQILNVIDKGISTDVKDIAFSPKGRIFTIASGAFRISIWDIRSLMKLAELDEGLKDGFGAYSVAFSSDGRMLASADARRIKLWDLESEKVILKWEAHAPYIQSIAYSPDGRLLASAGSDRVVKLWDVQTGKLVRTMSGHRAIVHSLAFNPDGKTLASCSDDFTVRIWDVATGKTAKTFTEKYFVLSVAFTPDGKTVAGAVYRSIKLWKL